MTENRENQQMSHEQAHFHHFIFESEQLFMGSNLIVQPETQIVNQGVVIPRR